MKNATPAMREILDAIRDFKAPPFENLSPENARNLPTFSDAVATVVGRHVLKRALPSPDPVSDVRHILIPGQAGDLLARVYRPQKAPFAQNLPVLLYFHGGGWVVGNLDSYDSSCRALCNESDHLVVSLAYRLAPEHPFPAAVNDAYDAYRWLLENAKVIGGDFTRITVGGESAGGNLAAVVCLKAKENHFPLPNHQLLIYPLTDFTFQGESHRTYEDASPLNQAMLAWFRKYYLRKRLDVTHPDASPLFAREYAGLPPTTIVLAELDPLYSDGELYGDTLRASGVPVRLKTFKGVTHEFFGAKALLPEARDAIVFASDGLRSAADCGFHGIHRAS